MIARNPIHILGLPLSLFAVHEQIGVLLFLWSALNVIWLIWVFTGKDEKLKALVVLLVATALFYSAMLAANMYTAYQNKEEDTFTKKVDIKQGPFDVSADSLCCMKVPVFVLLSILLIGQTSV